MSRTTPNFVSGEMTAQAVAPTPLSDVLPSVNPELELNYSLLHNNRPLFERFSIYKKTSEEGSVRITVELFQGEISMPFKATVPLKKDEETIHFYDEHGKETEALVIRLPLASRMLRSLREPVRSTMQVQIAPSVGQAFLWEQTYFVTLLPVDQWRDTPDYWQLLPSFLQPRDPVIAKIIEQAQKYLMALSDDFSAGFDGYQSIVRVAPDEAPNAAQAVGVDDAAPAAAEVASGTPTETSAVVDTLDNLDCNGVDLQVRAIWAALLFDYQLFYINPPPEYRRDSQRIRRPTEVIEGCRGTCIDLAILLASCLEWIDVFPVVFLLKNHAFPGYWRSETLQKQFVAEAAKITPNRRNPKEKEFKKWCFAEDPFYYLIRDAVARGELVPLETIDLTQRESFQTALDHGLENLRSKFEFDAMIDIKTAREFKITPIPLAGEF
ncbi:MAG: hypothetical protein HYX68_29145 [Planctomycetes bacterium]|nr:hypothetical protein [Planctomycetota bacterium]